MSYAYRRGPFEVLSDCQRYLQQLASSAYFKNAEKLHVPWVGDKSWQTEAGSCLVKIVNALEVVQNLVDKEYANQMPSKVIEPIRQLMADCVLIAEPRMVNGQIVTVRRVNPCRTYTDLQVRLSTIIREFRSIMQRDQSQLVSNSKSLEPFLTATKV